MDVWALADDGTRISFEASGLTDVVDATIYAVDAVRNVFQPHIWDNDELCLPVGSTELFVKGHQATNLPFDDLPLDRDPGEWVPLQTNPDPGITPRVLAVRLIAIEDVTDPLVNDPITGHDITRLEWEPEQTTRRWTARFSQCVAIWCQ